VGKSCLLSRFAHDDFDADSTSTLGIDFSSKVVKVDDTLAKLELWDTAGRRVCVCVLVSMPLWPLERDTACLFPYHYISQN
jgi:GTPase SAR1 family protein